MIFYTFLYLIATIALHAASVEELSNRLHVCTVANNTHPNLNKLITSSQQNGIELEILGMGRPYRANTDKLRIMRDYCHQLPDDDLVLFVDAFDVLILADKQEIVSRFLAFEAPMVMSTEMNCWPSSEAKAFHPPTDSPFKYINTGGYIGWVKAVRQWLNAFNESLLSNKSDQKAAHQLFAKKPHFYALDHWCSIFLCLYLVPVNAVFIDEANRKIICSYTNSSPCILHANGKSFTIWDQVYSLFF